MIHKIRICTMTASLFTSLLYAGGSVVSVAPKIIEANPIDNTTFFKTVDGYARFGYQNAGSGVEDMALGGKLHVETNVWNGLSAGASFYTTHAIGSHDGAGMIFFDSNNDSYDILGEAYLQAQYGNTTLKAGRQEIDTPYADTDDNGMIPNTFEAYVLSNTDISGTTLIAAYISKMAGIDAALPEKFTDIDIDGGISSFAVIYEGIENLVLQGWYYDVKDSAGDRGFTYFDAVYGGQIDTFVYEVAAQYSTQDAFTGDADGDAKIFGFSATVSHEPSGLTLAAAYDRVSGTASVDGFGGGPLYSSAENLTLSSGAADAKTTYFVAEWDAGVVSLDGLSFAAGYFTLTDKDDVEATELNLALSYAYNDHLRLNMIYYDTDDKINKESYKSTRIFANYVF